MTASPEGQRVSLPLRCLNCDAGLETPLVCTSCHQLLQADEADHFALLGIPRTFDIDAAALRRRYLELAREVHPDRVSDDQSAALSVSATARLNEAVEMLSSPLRRAEYLLHLAGGASAAEDKTVATDVLAATLMLREELDEARADNDAATVTALLDSIRQEFETRLEQVAALARELPADETHRTHLRHALNALKYYDKMLNEA